MRAGKSVTVSSAALIVIASILLTAADSQDRAAL
jgi:hypothetical protein